MADEWLSLTHALTQTMRAHAPGWTDHNDSDPGITILELIAYLAESLRLHATSSEKLSSAAIRAIRALEAVTDREPVAVFVTERWSGTTRPNYFFGKVLGVEDFREEQQYHVGKHRRHLQTLHGSGVARGLDVSVSSDGTSMTVVSGVAIDASGHEIVLDDPVLITPPPDAPSPAWIVLEYAERAIDVVPTPNDEPQASRIQEGCRIALAASPSDSGVTLARLLNEANGWRVDRAFVPGRAR